MASRAAYCVICGKPPEQANQCPTCGTENICRYHIYSIFSDQEKSPKGCPKCGPRCAVCHTQTTLITYKKREICVSCKMAMSYSEEFKTERMKQLMETMETVMMTSLTIIGLIVGVYLGLQPSFHKMVLNFTKTEIPGFLITSTWALTGLISGSLLASFLNSIIKKFR